MRTNRAVLIFSFVLSVALMVNFVGLAEEDDPNLGLVVNNMAATSHARVANAVQEHAKEVGWEVTMLDSQGSVPNLANNLENLVTKGVDGIIMVMGKPREIKDTMEQAFEAGIPMVTVDTVYMEGVVVDIKADNFVMGSKITTYLFDRLSYEGDVIAFKFDKHVGVRRRGKVFEVELSEYEGINLLAEHYMPASAGYMEDTRNTMQTFITQYGDEIDAVWCGFDELAYAVTDVLRSHGYTREDILVTGVDGNQETFRRMRDPESPLVATVAQPFELEGRKAVDVLSKIVIEGQTAEEVVGSRKTIYMDAPLVTQANVPEEGEWPW